MNNKELLSSFKLLPQILDFSVQGIDLMTEAKDPIHNDQHVLRLLKDLSLFTTENSGFAFDSNVIVPAICWHDIWKSRRQSSNIATIALEQLIEGSLSALITKKYMTRFDIPNNIQSQILYAISRHPKFELRKRKTVESRLLVDLDRLDRWSPERLEQARSYVQTNRGLSLILRRLRLVILSDRMKTGRYYHPWFKKMHSDKFPLFLEKMNALI